VCAKYTTNETGSWQWSALANQTTYHFKS